MWEQYRFKNDQVETKKKKWQERFHSICKDCFEKTLKCSHCPEQPLRLLIVGHNPSHHSWTSGYSYSNPSNRMWKLMTGTILVNGKRWKGILPHRWTIFRQNTLPSDFGIGLTDLGLEPGNDASLYSRKTMLNWKKDFYKRIRDHLHRVGRAPVVIAFTGKRQFSQLFDPPLKKVHNYGKQSILPPDWPVSSHSQVWILPSSSGRAAMSTQERVKPYQELAERLDKVPWPLV